jgi:NAD-dependent DNA ligase
MKKLLDAASTAYYQGIPFMSDAEFDILCEECDYDPLGYKGDFEFAHLFPMYSLKKVFFGEQHPPYDHNEDETIISPKLDGAAVSLSYYNGELVLALTRGDGRRGRDITDKMRHLVPEDIDSVGAVQITGEVVAPESIPNSRNYASGALNLKSLEDFLEREVRFVAYDVQPAMNQYWTEDLTGLVRAGFDTVIQSDWAGYPQDGVVFRTNDRAKYEEAGYTSRHPRGAFALKMRPDGVVTQLLDVTWQVGKSGVVSPVAILEPVKVGDATVSRATLHNIRYIEDLGLKIGCNVEIIRAGEIIPRIVRRV